MEFSIARTLVYTPAHLTDVLIYGRNGIDIRARLVMWKSLKGQGLTDHLRKTKLLRALPLELGERFRGGAVALTALLGTLFIWLANGQVREFVFQLHRLTGGPLDYVLLAVQWWAFYLLVSAVAALLTSLVAFQVYASRLTKYHHDETASNMEHQHIANAVLSAANNAVACHCDESMKMLEIDPTHRAMFECTYFALVLSVLEVAVHEKYSAQAAEYIMSGVIQRLSAAGRESWFEGALQQARHRYIEIGLVSASNSPFTDESSVSWSKVFTSELAGFHRIPCSEWKACLWAVTTIGATDNASRQL